MELSKRAMSTFQRTQGLYCIGDSHCLPLKDRIVCTDIEKTPLLISSSYLVGFCSTEFLDSAGHLSAELQNALKQNGLMNDQGESHWVGLDRTAINTAFAAGSPSTAPILIVFCGDIDLRGYIFKQFQDVYDFDLPDGEGVHVPGTKKLSYDSVEDLLTSRYAPIVQGIVALYKAGFSRTYLAALPPPSLENEQEFADAHGFPCPLMMRKKLTKLSNAVLERLCQVANVPFLNVTDEVATDGILRSEYRLDGFHMSANGGVKLIDLAIDHAVHNSTRHVNQHLYKHAQNNAEAPTFNHTSEFKASQSDFSDNALIQVATSCDGILREIEHLPIDDSVANKHMRLSWFGTSRTPFNKNMRTLRPSRDLLAAVYEYIYSDEVLPHLQAALNGDPHVINARFFRSLPHTDEAVGPQTFHFDGAPPGVMRALIYLTDVDRESGPFEFRNGSSESELAIGAKGTLLIFDPNTLEHRGSPPSANERIVVDLCVSARPIGFPRRVAWAGMNAWPLDPYQFAVDDMLAEPDFQSDWVQVYPFEQNASS